MGLACGDSESGAKGLAHVVQTSAMGFGNVHSDTVHRLCGGGSREGVAAQLSFWAIKFDDVLCCAHQGGGRAIRGCTGMGWGGVGGDKGVVTRGVLAGWGCTPPTTNHRIPQGYGVM